MNDLISRRAAIDTLATGEELLNRVLDDMDVVGNEREKYEWGLGLIESYIDDMKELPSVQPEGTIDRKQAIDAALEIIGDSAHRKAWEIVAMLKRLGKEEENDDNERVSEADR